MRVSKQNLNLLLSALCAILSLFTYGCGDEGETISNCDSSGLLCSVRSSGKEAELNISKLRPGQEVFIVFLSRAEVKNINKMRHPVFISTQTPSAPMPQAEKDLINKIQSRTRSINQNIDEDLQNIILPPRDSYFSGGAENIGDIQDFYVPVSGDYRTKINSSDSVPVWIPSPSGRVVSGKSFNFVSLAKMPGVYELRKNSADNLTSMQPEIDKLDQCLKKLFPKAQQLLGTPLYRMRGDPEVQVMITRFEGDKADRTIGLFSSVDRAKTDDGKALPDSNRGEIIYVAPPRDASKTCSTTLHEYQHLISFDHKVLAQLSESNRFDLAAQSSTSVSPEWTGLNEGYSHILEELSGERQIVPDHIYRFLSGVNGSTFSLDASWSDNLANSRTRGLNTLFLYYALRQAGGTLNFDDPITQKTLQSLIHSKNTGFDNIASSLGTKSDDLLQDFFVKLVATLYSSEKASAFIPPFESAQSPTRGIRFLSRADPYEKIPFRPPYIHPLQIPAPELSSSEYTDLPYEGMLFFRYIAPPSISSKSRIKFSTNGQSFMVFQIPTKI